MFQTIIMIDYIYFTSGWETPIQLIIIHLFLSSNSTFFHKCYNEVQDYLYSKTLLKLYRKTLLKYFFTVKFY
jgi:hypothetical protein